MSRARAGEVWSIDDLELELRKLPGVRAAGFEELDDVLLVQLHVAERVEHIQRADRTDQPVPVSASRIAARHSDRPVAVEIVRWRTAPVVPPAPAPATERVSPEAATSEIAESSGPERREAARARLLAVLAFPDTDELEVHHVLDGKRTIGRAPVSRGAEAAVEATLDAVRDLGTGLRARVRWARTLDALELGEHGGRQVVAVALEGVDARSPMHLGLAAGTSLIDAAARATLDALNRHLGREH